MPLVALAAGNITDIGKNSAEFGVISGSYANVGHELHYAKYDGKTYLTFCTQYGITSPTGRTYDSSEFSAYKNKNNATYQKVAKYIYFGYTMLYGDGLPDTVAKWEAACCTQQYVWEELINAPSQSSWNSSYMSPSKYADWKQKTDGYIDLYYNTNVSFDKNTVKLNYNSKQTITDTNKVLKYYPSFEKTVNGVTYSHIKGNNFIVINTTNSAMSHNSSFNSFDYHIDRAMPNGDDYDSNINNFVSFEFNDSNVQNLMFSNFVDPQTFQFDVNVTWGSAEITKTLDTTKNNGKYGDVAISEAEYSIYAKNDITSTDGTDVIYKKDTKVASSSITASANGKTGTASFDKLPYGAYYIKETKAPTGTRIDTKEYDVVINSTTEKKASSTNEINSMKVKIFKSGTNGDAGQLAGLQGAEFTIKLNSDYQQALKQGYKYSEIWSYVDKTTNKWVGINESGQVVNVDVARAEKANAIAPTYSKVTTNASGNAVTGYMPYGQFIAKETKTPDNFKSGNDFLFNITKDESQVAVENQVVNINVNNSPFSSYVKIIKKDVESKKSVTYSSATFKIRATQDIYDTSSGKLLYAKDTYVEHKQGSNKYNEFMTNSDGYVVPATGNVYASTNDEKGTVLTPFKLPAGNYEIVEQTNPNGFLLSTQTQPFTVTSVYTYDTDADGDAVVNVQYENEQPKGKIVVNKSFLQRENIDKTLIENYDYTKVSFELIAKTDILDMSDGSIVYPEGTSVGTYSLNTEGKLELDNLWIGNYFIKEISTIDGAVLDDTEYDVVFTVEDNTTAVYTQTLDIVNYTTEIDISKTDITEEPELVGAELSVTDQEGNVVDSWTSTITPHKIEGLNVEQTYILNEQIAPNGFAVANSIEFVVKNTKEVQPVKMIDKQVIASKIDITTGTELEGAELSVTDQDGNVVDSWTSTTTPHIINGLVEGQTYTMTEKTAPYGFAIAENVEFTVTDDKETQRVIMKDDYIYSSVRVVKCDKTTKEAIKSNKFEFTVYSDKECKNEIKTSGANENEGTALFEKMTYNTYYIKETKAPTGYALSDQVVEIVINDKGVFADGKSLTESNGVYSFEYYNELLPVINTGDISKETLKKLIIMGAILVIFVIIFIIVSKKMKKK